MTQGTHSLHPAKNSDMDYILAHEHVVLCKVIRGILIADTITTSATALILV